MGCCFGSDPQQVAEISVRIAEQRFYHTLRFSCVQVTNPKSHSPAEVKELPFLRTL